MHQVFISYKSEDSAIAMRVCSLLEGAAIPCWIAQRDIGPGANYASEIPAAIRSSQVVVLILTENAMSSPWIPKELDSAISLRRQILPLMVGHFDLSPTLSFLLTGIQFYDATADLDATVIRVLPKIRQFIAETKPAGAAHPPKAAKTRSHDLLYFFLSIAVLLVLLHFLDVIDMEKVLKEVRQWLDPALAWLKAKLPPAVR